VDLVRAAMAVRANQLGAGGAGVAAGLLDTLVALLNAGLTPVTRELGSLGTGDLTALADVGLALLGEGRVWRCNRIVDAAGALADAQIAPARLGPRDGLAFISSNAVTVGHAALLVVDVHRMFDAWLSVAALSFEAAGADPIVLDPRIHSARHRPGQSAVAARMRELLAGVRPRARDRGPLGIQDPYPFRALPQVDGAVHEALTALEETVGHELNLAGENALIVSESGVALPNGNPHAAPLAGAIDHLRTALAQSAALIAARVSTLLDSSLTGLPPFLARDPGPESGALVVEYTAHAAAAEVRSLVTPVAAQTVAVSRGVESHSSLAPIAARRAHETLQALQVLIATELVVAVRALRLARHEPTGAGTRSLFEAAAAELNPELEDRPLHPDIEAARIMIDGWRVPAATA
jgi:histidine ammonia-lyase